jgi:hypothetical protein
MSKYDTYTQGAGGNDPMEQSGRADPSHVEDAANRKRIQNRIAQKAYRKFFNQETLATNHLRDCRSETKIQDGSARKLSRYSNSCKVVGTHCYFPRDRLRKLATKDCAWIWRTSSSHHTTFGTIVHRVNAWRDP